MFVIPIFAGTTQMTISSQQGRDEIISVQRKAEFTAREIISFYPHQEVGMTYWM